MSKEGITYSAELNTEVRVIYNEDALCISVRCEKPDMKNSGKQKDGLLLH